MFQQVNKQHTNYHFRYFLKADYEKGLFQLLSNLTKAPLPDKQLYQKHLKLMQSSKQKHINIAAVNKQTGKLVAFGSILICTGIAQTKGKIENIVTCKSVRGKGLGLSIIELLKWIGWNNGCDVVTLFCEQKNVKFYNKLGFKQQGMIHGCYKL